MRSIGLHIRSFQIEFSTLVLTKRESGLQEILHFFPAANAEIDPGRALLP